MTRLVFALAMFTGSSVFAQSRSPQTHAHYFQREASTNDYNLLEGVALNAAAAARTIAVDLASVVRAGTGDGWGKLRVSVFFTYAAATAVTAAFSCSQDGTNYATPTSRSCSAGACAASTMTDTVSLAAADVDFQLEYDVRGCQKAKIVFGGAGAGSTDLVDVQAVAIAGE